MHSYQCARALPLSHTWRVLLRHKKNSEKGSIIKTTISWQEICNHLSRKNWLTCSDTQLSNLFTWRDARGMTLTVIDCARMTVCDYITHTYASCRLQYLDRYGVCKEIASQWIDGLVLDLHRTIQCKYTRGRWSSLTMKHFLMVNGAAIIGSIIL